MKAGVKKILPRTLLGRSLMILVTPILLIQIITTFVFFDSHWSKMTGRLAFAVAGEIAVIADRIEKNPSAENITEVSGWAGQNLELLVSFEPEVRLENFYDQQQQSLRGFEVAPILSEALQAQVRRPFDINVDANEKWVEVTVQISGGVVRISLPHRRLFSSSIYLLLRWMIFTSIVLLIVAVLFMRNQIRPIRRLAVVAERFGKGMDAPASFKPEGAREVRQAGHAFLEMQNRIKRQIQQRTAMLAGVSHDLRTPLTRMKLQAAMMGNNPDVEALKSDLSEMERMIDAYLDFARGEGGEASERMDVSVVLDRLISGAKRQGAKVESDIARDIFAHIRPIAFERCVANIINNARKYGGDIWVSAKKTDENLEIAIEDNGPGIPEDKLADVFRPFYRIEESRNRTTGGVGLGLAISQDIIHSHGGEILLSQSVHGGLSVKIILPG